MPCICENQDTYWHYIKCACLHSLTVGWAYLLIVVPVAVDLITSIPDIASSIGIQQYIPPSWLLYYTSAIGIITLIARLRSILKGMQHVRDFGEHPEFHPRPDEPGEHLG